MVFFSQPKLKTDVFVPVIKKLTEIRKSNYKITLINQMKVEEFSDLEALVLSMGNKILKANHNEFNETQLSDTQANFRQTIEFFFASRNKFVITYFSAQLLQYYTIICNDEFKPNTSLQDFLIFLGSNLESFGSVDNNLFITEYKLIKIYNDLCRLTDSSSEENFSTPEIEAECNILLEQLNKIKIQVDRWCMDAPSNIFLQYLTFVINYSSAKVIELQYSIKGSSIELDEQNLLHKCQKIFLNASKGNLEKIITLNKEQSHTSVIAGTEFSLGQNILVKLPNVDLNKIKEHVVSLISN